MVAHVFKGNNVDDGSFPLPPDPRKTHQTNQPHGGAGTASGQSFAGVEPAELQHSLGELQQMVGLITGMRPQVQEVAEALRGAGQEAGYQDGFAQAQAEVQQQLVEALAAVTAGQQERHKIALDHEAALAELGMKIARRVIGAHLESDPKLVQRIVRETIQELEPSTALEVRVNPDDLPIVEEGRAELERLVQGPGALTISPDESVDRGGVILSSPVGDVDARISTKLSVLETAFAAQRRSLIDGR